jgi:hypothetical protein
VLNQSRILLPIAGWLPPTKNYDPKPYKDGDKDQVSRSSSPAVSAAGWKSTGSSLLTKAVDLNRKR